MVIPFESYHFCSCKGELNPTKAEAKAYRAALRKAKSEESENIDKIYVLEARQKALKLWEEEQLKRKSIEEGEEFDPVKTKNKIYRSWYDVTVGHKYIEQGQEYDPVETKVEIYKLWKEIIVGREEINSNSNDGDGKFPINFPSEGRQTFTRWNWSYPNRMTLRSKTFSIKYEKSLSAVEKLLLQNVQKKYLYHAIHDILDSLKSQPLERNNLLAILYSIVLSLQNNFFIDFFDIWIDEIYTHKISKRNKFLTDNNSNFEPFTYITIKLVYNKKLLPKKPEAFW